MCYRLHWIDGCAVRGFGSKIGLQAALLYSPCTLFFRLRRQDDGKKGDARLSSRTCSGTGMTKH